MDSWWVERMRFGMGDEERSEGSYSGLMMAENDEENQS